MNYTPSAIGTTHFVTMDFNPWYLRIGGVKEIK